MAGARRHHLCAAPGGGVSCGLAMVGALFGSALVLSLYQSSAPLLAVVDAPWTLRSLWRPSLAAKNWHVREIFANACQSQSQQDPLAVPPRMPPRMKAALEQYRKRVWVIKLAEGALAAIFGLVISYLFVFGLDRLFDTPAVLRAVILAAGSVGMVILFPVKYHNWVWSHRRLDQVARLLRHKFPRFSDHLLGIVELAQSESQQGASRALVEAAMRQVDAQSRFYRFLK